MMWTLLPDMNVAPLKYAHVLKKSGGPLENVSAREVSVAGVKYFEAYAFVSAEKGGASLGIGPHGVGLALQKPDAVHMAISEAMETWAWRTAAADAKLSASLRFDIDDSRTGFAAFPGLGVQGARKRAYFEAAQKWILSAWWERNLRHSSLNQANGILISGAVPAAYTVVIWEAARDLTHYGIGTSFSAAAALERAKQSLVRHIRALEIEPESALARLKYFASAAGTEAFCKRIEKQGALLPAPTLLADQAVLGPWHQYAHLWRCLFDCSRFHEKGKEHFFLF